MILATATAFYLACNMLTAGIAHEEPQAGEYDPFTGADYFLQYNFEDDEDKEFDRLPDDWSARKGNGFPHFVQKKIDQTRGQGGSRKSLRFKVNGGRAIYYSPPHLIDPLHSYVFEGYVRTQKLHHDAALISVSLLNHKRQRIQRFLSIPISGTHKEWVRVRIPGIVPQPDVQFVVVGCHLVHGGKMDIEGSVWFDSLRMGSLPQMNLVSNHHKHFVQPHASINIQAEVSGLDKKRDYQLHLKMINSNDEIIQKKDISREINQQPNQTDGSSGSIARRYAKPWELPPQKSGFYRVRSTLESDGMVILEKETSFAVMDLVETYREHGEFGWSVASGIKGMSSEWSSKLAEISKEAGINWLKYPLWQSVYGEDIQLPAHISKMFDELLHYKVTPIGLLNNPPKELRKKFADDWIGISEIFTMPPSFWRPSLDPVIARFSSNVRHWQLGSDVDGSFVGLSSLGETQFNVKREFDQIGRDTRIGIPWNWNTPLPSQEELPQGFLSIRSNKRLSGPELINKLLASQRSGMTRWVMLKPLPKPRLSEHENKEDFARKSEERGADLVKRMVAAKIGGAEAIFAFDVFDEQYGLLNKNGSPTLLFLPWRTTALALQGTEFLGSFNMPSGSRNFVFAREGEVVMIIWNDDTSASETVEEIYLGQKVTATDVWGRQWTIPVNKKTNRV